MQADQINSLKPLEILDFLLDLASRQPAPELKRTKRCVFCLVFPALLNFVPIVILLRGGLFLFLLGHANPTRFRPMSPKHNKL